MSLDTPAQPVGSPLVPSRDAPDPRRWRALAVLALVQFLIVTDNTIVNVALPAIRADLGFTTAGLAWVVDGYMLAAGGLLLLGGRLGDRVGYRRMFLAGTCLFGLASLTSGLAGSPGVLVVSRFGQGIGEAIAAPAALALLAGLFSGAERAKALGVWGGLAGLGSTVGVLLSGLLVEWAQWRWVFLVNIPFALAAVVLAPRLVPADGPRRTREPLDLVGAVLVTAGLTLVVDGLLRAAQHGWGSAGSVVPVLAGAGCLVAFVVVEARVARPLVPLGFLRSRSRVSANVVSALVAGAMAGMFVLLTIYLQTVLHWSPLQTGVAYLPFCLAFAPGFGLSVLLVKRAGTRVALVTALGVCTVGMLLMARIGPAADYPGTLLPAMVVLAVGLGMAFPTAQNAALAGVSEGTTGLASGVQTTCQALGGALGVAVLVGIATGVAQGGADPGGATVHGDRVAFLVAAGAYAVAAVIAVVGVREAPDASGALLPASADSHPE